MFIKKKLGTPSDTTHSLIEKGSFVGILQVVPGWAYAGVVLVGFAAAMVVLNNNSDVTQLTDFHARHVDVGRTASKGASGCSQYAQSRLSSRINDPRFVTNNTNNTLLDGKVVATVSCETVPTQATSATYAATKATYSGIHVTYVNLDDTTCSKFLDSMANTSWVVLGYTNAEATIGNKKIVKAYNEDIASGMGFDGVSVCHAGDGLNTLEIWDRL